MSNKEYKYSDITEKIIGCAMKVHTFLGNGFPEIIYQRSLAIELKHSNLGFNQELEQQIYYNEINIGTRRVDFLIDGKILVELKAVSELTDNLFSQILNYLTAFNLEIGLLINFGERSLKVRRFINSKFKEIINK
ncbi:MAG TPA: GxxExxY protein [Ignavibacteria bacterium]|nr:GxxExxY protein [Ignavibacteria bacterium]